MRWCAAIIQSHIDEAHASAQLAWVTLRVAKRFIGTGD